jgi:hypothetical protein
MSARGTLLHFAACRLSRQNRTFRSAGGERLPRSNESVSKLPLAVRTLLGLKNYSIAPLDHSRQCVGCMSSRRRVLASIQQPAWYRHGLWIACTPSLSMTATPKSWFVGIASLEVISRHIVGPSLLPFRRRGSATSSRLNSDFEVAAEPRGSDR